MTAYRTVACAAQSEYIVEKSQFLSFCVPVIAPQEAAAAVALLRKRHPGATHVCYAYALRSGEKKFSDDGEPQGTAGMPIAEVLRNKDVTDALVAVVRYFGGRKLGAGGLVRAYTEAAVRGIEAAGVKPMTLCVLCRVRYPFAMAGKPLPYTVTDRVYGTAVEVTYAVPVAEKQSFFALISEQFAGACPVDALGDRYIQYQEKTPYDTH
ncbi:MAG: YigZ family protein [Clostridiales bacterium]|jgi:uncharacterized YigZ family protein|nr:YigZ family protein [Clostridiales bacterium]